MAHGLHVSTKCFPNLNSSDGIGAKDLLSKIEGEGSDLFRQRVANSVSGILGQRLVQVQDLVQGHPRGVDTATSRVAFGDALVIGRVHTKPVQRLDCRVRRLQGLYLIGPPVVPRLVVDRLDIRGRDLNFIAVPVLLRLRLGTLVRRLGGGLWLGGWLRWYRVWFELLRDISAKLKIVQCVNKFTHRLSHGPQVFRLQTGLTSRTPCVCYTLPEHHLDRMGLIDRPVLFQVVYSHKAKLVLILEVVPPEVLALLWRQFDPFLWENLYSSLGGGGRGGRGLRLPTRLDLLNQAQPFRICLLQSIQHPLYNGVLDLLCPHTCFTNRVQKVRDDCRVEL